MGAKQEVEAALAAVQQITKAMPLHEQLLKERLDALSGLCSSLAGISDEDEFDRTTDAIHSMLWGMRDLRRTATAMAGGAVKASKGAGPVPDGVAKCADAAALVKTAVGSAAMPDALKQLVENLEKADAETGPDGKPKRKLPFPGAAPPFKAAADAAPAAASSTMPTETPAAQAPPASTAADVFKETWDTKYVNDLPDSAFLYVESGGKKDADGKTEPRSLRHFPVKDASGKLDRPHLANARSRIPQSDVPQAAKDKAMAEAARLLEEEDKAQKADDFTVDPKAPPPVLPADLNCPEFLDKRDPGEPTFGRDRPLERPAQ